MATFSFSNRTSRLQSSTMRRSLSLTGPVRTFDAPRVGPQGFKFKMYGIDTVDGLRGVSINSQEAEGVLEPSGSDVIYYNNSTSSNSSTLVMDIFVNGFYRSTIEFVAEKLGQPFGYSLGVVPQISPVTAPDDALFTDYLEVGEFTEGQVNLIIQEVTITEPIVPTGLPIEPTPTATELLPPPTPEPTPFGTPEPTSTELPTATPEATPEPTPTPTASETPTPTPTASPEPTPTPTSA